MTDLESTATLLSRVKQGDGRARERLCAIYLPILNRWAHGRLPPQARDLAETEDMVQASLIKALDRIDEFESLHEGAFLAYLRKILINNIRMEIRRVSRQLDRVDGEREWADGTASQVESMIGNELMEQYEKALTLMPAESREAVILRVEFGFTYPEVAAAMNCASANAARMLVTRALTRLAERIHG